MLMENIRNEKKNTETYYNDKIERKNRQNEYIRI